MKIGFVAASLLGAAAIIGAAHAAPQAKTHRAGASRVVSIATAPGASVSRKMNLALNKAAIIELDADARDVLVSNPEIVDAVVRSPRRIYLLAMKSGETNAFFFDAAGHQILSLDIQVERDVSDLEAIFHRDMPGDDIKITSLNDSVILSGTVRSSLDSTQAQDIAARFVGSPDKVVNMLKIAAKEQVMLKVRIAEMQRTVAKQFGINAASAGYVGGVPLALATDNQFGLLGRALSDISGAQAGQICSNGAFPLTPGTTCTIQNNAEGTLKALETVGLVHMLAEPNLTAVSGETAKFLAGGEFPVPASRDRDGNVTVTFKQFGVGLSFTPVVLSENRISLQISTEVSQLTNTGAFTLQGGTVTNADGTTTTTTGGLTIPALDVRRAETTVEMPSGGSFAIAGLLQHNSKQAIERFPGLGQLPVLGALFRSRDFQDDQSELVVLVSSYLVNPTAESKLAAPTDGFVPPNDMQTILMGRLNRVYQGKSDAIRAASNGSVGYIVQ